MKRLLQRTLGHRINIKPKKMREEIRKMGKIKERTVKKKPVARVVQAEGTKVVYEKKWPNYGNSWARILKREPRIKERALESSTGINGWMYGGLSTLLS